MTTPRPQGVPGPAKHHTQGPTSRLTAPTCTLHRVVPSPDRHISPVPKHDVVAGAENIYFIKMFRSIFSSIYSENEVYTYSREARLWVTPSLRPQQGDYGNMKSTQLQSSI